MIYTPPSLINHGTPIEEYAIDGITVYVKREDLSTNPPMPPLAKMRGAYELAVKKKKEGYKVLGHADTIFSKAGLGLAIICRELGLRCVVGYPQHKDAPTPPQHVEARNYGAELLPLKGGRVSINYYRTRNHVQALGGYMYPWGVCCPESVLAVAVEALTVPDELLTGTLVMCVGSATMISGVLVGVETLPNVIGISSGVTNHKQMRTIRQYIAAQANPSRVAELDHRLTLVPPIMPYNDECAAPVPFPAHPNYDAKAWFWLTQHIHELKQPILFWNIGA